mgnify:FL=1
MAIFLLPWWMVVISAVVILFFTDRYYEFIFAGFFMDALYGNNIVLLNNFNFVYFGTSIILYIVLNKLKTLLRSNV